MSGQPRILKMRFDGTVTDRREFLNRIREGVTRLTGEAMTLDALINEIAKNIFDHAHGMGSMVIEPENGMFRFEIKDDGEDGYDFEYCTTHSMLVGNGVNFGVGLRTIRDLARSLNIDLCIDSSRGFSYSGTYVPRRCVD